MKLNNLKIGTQLKLGFAAMLILAIVMGLVSIRQNLTLIDQTETMYSHPLEVRAAVGVLESNILSISIAERDLLLANNDHEQQMAIQTMELFQANAFKQFDIIYSQYLGPRSNIDDAYKAFVIWNSERDKKTDLVLSEKKGNTSLILKSTDNDNLLTKLKIVDNFAKNKAEFLYTKSKENGKTMNLHLMILLAVILLITIVINVFLLNNIRKPLTDLTNAANNFHNNNLDARSSYVSTNEFGELSSAFNIMLQTIQENIVLNEKFTNLASLMLSEYDAKKIFQSTLNTMASHTGSQMAAIYLLSTDKKTFDHFESTGADNNARKSFAADSFEGEFGLALSSKKIQHIKNIPEDTRFIFYTVAGKFIPREIMTLPIIADNEVVAIISLASLNHYTKQAIQLIDNILVTLCARVEGIMAFHRIKEFSKQLEQQNIELDAQKSELSVQSAELLEQNIELEMQKTQLGEASRLKTNFLSNMSHELRTPLNSVIALTGVLNRRLVNLIPDEEYSYLDVIERNGKHLLELINDILDISRIEAGHETIEISNFNASNLIADIVNNIQPQAQQKSIKLLFPEANKVFQMSTDAVKCHHILQNLIGNAIKFTEKGSVQISVHQTNNNISITVTDSGIGISETHLPHIFDEFRQADGSTSRRFGGTGLGLAIAKKYANLLGGIISVTSKIDKGSAFTLTLPVHYSVENRIIDAPIPIHIKKQLNQSQSKPTSLQKTILLIEDSEPAIIQLKDFFEGSGYHILSALEGNEALKIIEETIPDAIVLDLMLPGIDGFELLKTIRNAEQTAHIPVLILTAKHITKDDLFFLTRNNIHQLIQKGDVNRAELLHAVASMVYPQAAAMEEQSISNSASITTPFVSKPKINPSEHADPLNLPVVLVVEDNPDNMITVKALLADKFIVLEAVDGIMAVEMAKTHEINLILMDIALPGMDGISAFKEIRKLPKAQHVPIVALTASALTSDREIILAYGFDAYIVKPIDQNLFFKVINEILYGK